MKHLFLLLSLCLGLLTSHAKENRVALLGDSIAYAGPWATLIQGGLENTPEFKDAYIVNLGLPSETTSGLSEDNHANGAFPRPCLHERLSRILEKFQPTLIIACYGMNDGILLPIDEERFSAFKEGMSKLKEEANKAGSRIIFITPPLYQPDLKETPSDHYDKTLDAYSEWLVSKRQNGWEVVDMRPALKNLVAEEKKKNPHFIYAGDGVHPGKEGHHMIALAIWPELSQLLGLPSSPQFPEGDEYNSLFQKEEARKLAWLTETRHTRPGIPQGAALPQLKYAEKGIKTSLWQDFVRCDFTVEGRPCLLICPETPAKGSPWIWRTEFFGHEPQADIALLKKGFHLAYMDIQNMYGSPDSIVLMDRFYDFLLKNYHLSPKPVLEGFSRGGLYAFNWASANPEKVSAIYVDAPVCDFKSWPGGRGKGKGSLEDWNRLLAAYGLTETEALAYKKNPVDNLAPLAKARVPILSIVGDDDDVVPVEENTSIIEKRYKKMGGKITVIHKPGVSHHPHSLENPQSIVDFVLEATK